MNTNARICSIRMLAFLTCVGISLAGCGATRKAIDSGGEKSRQVIGGIDPTGVVAASAEQRRTLASIREQVEAVDVAGFNHAVERLSAVTDVLAQRVEAVSPEDLSAAANELSAAIAALKTQLEDARIDQAVRSIRELTDTTQHSISALDMQNVQAVVDESSATLSDLRATIGQCSDDWQSVVRDLRAFLGEGTERVQALPLADVRDAVASLDLAVQDVRRVATDVQTAVPLVHATLDSARLAFRAVAGACVVLGICCVAWTLRRRSVPAS